MEKTSQQFNQQIEKCRSLYHKKTKDYGTAWRILRPSSLTDQLLIKANRIRTIEEQGQQKVDDPIDGEFIGLVNYSLMALIQLELPAEAPVELGETDALAYFDKQAAHCKALMEAKNHDYGEVWRDMRISSLTDLILQKLYRIKQIEDNEGATLVSEGLDANYSDIVNYSIFALIKLDEQEKA